MTRGHRRLETSRRRRRASRRSGERRVPFRRRHRLYGPIALYGGRVEPDNGCEEMLDYFDSYAATDGDTALVLMGVKMMRVADEPYLRQAGMLPDRERMVAYEAADVTHRAVADDLLAQSVLESFAVGTPVLASARTRPRSSTAGAVDGGLYYANREEFVEGSRLLMTKTADSPPARRERTPNMSTSTTDGTRSWTRFESPARFASGTAIDDEPRPDGCYSRVSSVVVPRRGRRPDGAAFVVVASRPPLFLRRRRRSRVA